VKNFDKLYLRQARLMAGLSLEEAANGICSVSLLSLIERGQRSANPEMLQALHVRLSIHAENITQQNESVELIQGCLALDNESSESSKEWLPRIKQANEKLLLQGLIAEAEGDLPLAVSLLELVAREKNQPVQTLHRAALALVRAEREQGDFYAAIYWGEQLVSHLKDQPFDTTSLQWEAKATLSSVYLELGDFAKAAELVKSRPDSIETTWDAVVQLWSSGQVAYQQGMFETATDQIRGAAQLISTLNRKMSQARLVCAAIYMEMSIGLLPTEKDVSDLEGALQLFRAEKNEKDIASSLHTKAQVMQRLGQLDVALGCVEESIARCASIGDFTKADILAENAKVLHDCREPARALEVLKQAAEAMAKLPKSRVSAKIWAQMAEVYEDLGQTAKALECYRHSSEAAGLSLKREAARASAAKASA
jgi:tetratricopeptide (TPR) repeat protein